MKSVMALLLVLYALLWVASQNPLLAVVLVIVLLGMWAGVATTQPS